MNDGNTHDINVNFGFQEKQVDARSREQLLRSFKEQESQSATKVCTLTDEDNTLQYNNVDIVPICDGCTQVCELQSSLKMYREELNVYQQQMEELKRNFESKLQKKSEKVECKILQSRVSTICPCLLSSAQPLTHVVLLPSPSGVLPAGEAARCLSGLSEHQRAEPAAAAVSAAAADHAG